MRALGLSVLLVGLANPCIATVTFDFAWVGNAGNAPDPETGFGAVSYEYAIAKTELTNAQYAEFLNAVDPTGENQLALYWRDMAGTRGGIENTGSADGARYVVKPGRENQPVSWINWYDAARFANWMHNGQGGGDTESGAYDFGSVAGVAEPSPFLSTHIKRSPDARYFLPSEDEWYKAAYHDASAGRAGAYFEFATTVLGADGRPISDHPADNPAAVNYFNEDFIANGFNDGFAVGPTPTGDANPFSDVGAYFLASSPYGTFDQNGSVGEWHDSLINGVDRGNRGGAWLVNFIGLRAGFRAAGSPLGFSAGSGIRIGSIPEPSALAMLIAVGTAPIRWQTRRRQR